MKPLENMVPDRERLRVLVICSASYHLVSFCLYCVTELFGLLESAEGQRFGV